MIRSMTAFARSANQNEAVNLIWELRSVNHRYLELSLRLPDAFRMLEMPLRDLARKHLQRGKIECQLKYQLGETLAPTVTLNHALAAQLIEASNQIKPLMESSTPSTTMNVLSWPNVVTVSSPDTEAFHSDCLEGFSQALLQLSETRQGEGAVLRQFIETRLTECLRQVEIVKTVMPELIAERREKLTSRIAELEIEIDQPRLEQELVMLVQRMDVSEELDRLEAHLAEVSRVLDVGGVMGRRLDFLMQELNREANTLSSKSSHQTTTMAAVELKVLIEQMREQVQNIE